tara:strand:+ start:29 stop:598 length:570 start_codon:yes stop_codon:yes gene_type:complete
MEVLKINCGGEIFTTYKETIDKLPNCPLKVCILGEGFNQSDDCIFIDISSKYFRYMLEFLRNEKTCYDVINKIKKYTGYLKIFMGWDIIEKTILDTIPPDLEWYNEKYKTKDYSSKVDEVIRQYNNLFDINIVKSDINYIYKQINDTMIYLPDPNVMDVYVSKINRKIKELELKITLDELMVLPNIILA